MREIQAPEPFDQPDLFLAGGITGARDWQREAIELLAPVRGTLLNPRRGGEFVPAYADEQVEWEHRALRASEAILFWFPPETLCPITLFELGVWSSQWAKRIFVGTDPAYARRFDVVKQLSLAMPNLRVHADLGATVAEYTRWLAR